VVCQYLGAGDSLKLSRQPRVDPGGGQRLLAYAEHAFMRPAVTTPHAVAQPEPPRVGVWRRASVAALAFIDFASFPVASASRSS